MRGKAPLNFRSVLPLLVFALLCWAQLPATACGYHDTPEERKNLHRGLLNWVYPNALHVRAPIWQAQDEGQLPQADAVSLQETVRVLRALSDRFSKMTPADRLEQFSMVLVESVLWSQFTVASSQSEVAIDVEGPVPGQLVVVTDEPVLYALEKNSLSLSLAVDSGLVKLYGQPEQIDNFLELFSSFGDKALTAL